MTPTEWSEIVDEVKSLWGTNSKWAQAVKAYKYAESLPAGAVRSAISSLFLEGKGNAPSPSEVLAVARTLVKHVATSDEIAVYCKANGHLWAIIHEEDQTRTVRCARCKTETTMLSTLVPTQGEIDAAVEKREMVEAAVTEQIAP